MGGQSHPRFRGRELANGARKRNFLKSAGHTFMHPCTKQWSLWAPFFLAVERIQFATLVVSTHKLHLFEPVLWKFCARRPVIAQKSSHPLGGLIGGRRTRTHRKTQINLGFPLAKWCGREDSNFHGSYPTATSTLRVYQFRHDRTWIGSRRIGQVRGIEKG